MNSITTCFDKVRTILENVPTDWVELTTHRLDLYDEKQAKSQFLERLQTLQASPNYDVSQLRTLPTAYDYIRLGHPLSSILEWLLAQINGVSSEQVIAFASKTMPILALLRKGATSGLAVHLYYDTDTSPLLDVARLEKFYGYKVQPEKVADASLIPDHGDDLVVFVTQSPYKTPLNVPARVDATVNIHPNYGSTIVIHNADIANLVKDVQHVRRRESIAMTPIDTLDVLHEIVMDKPNAPAQCPQESVDCVLACIQENTGSPVTPLVASSGLSIQYSMMMGLIEDAMTQHPDKTINLIIPPNCYGGTNDQARRISDVLPQVNIVDVHVDGGQDLVSSLDVALDDAAKSDCVSIILAEIPTNPRVEVPDMTKLASVLTKQRKTKHGTEAVAPVFTVDQTFCPNVKLLHQDSELAQVKTISYSSGSKFPSGGRCIAGFCTTNDAAKAVQPVIEKHLVLSDNAVTANQMNTLAENMPSMPQRIKDAYGKAREFVDHIQRVLPNAKINFISTELAERGFTPSVFSLDLPSSGASDKEREANKKLLNKKLIQHMIEKHPDDCKHCVSYGQLKGSYWTIPATSTQGTTSEKDKDYIVRVALSPKVDVEKLAASFTEFCHSESLLR